MAVILYVWCIILQYDLINALLFENLLAWISSLAVFKHEKEKFSGPTGELAGPAHFLPALGLGPAHKVKTEYDLYVTRAELSHSWPDDHLMPEHL